MSAYLHQRDLLFIVEALRPGSANPEQAAERLQITLCLSCDDNRVTVGGISWAEVIIPILSRRFKQPIGGRR